MDPTENNMQPLHASLEKMPEHERRILGGILRRARVSRNVQKAFEEQLTLGERLSDRVATVGGSWGFISGFGLFLVAWAALNSWLFAASAFDPYPYIFLNLILSMIAAIQAPIIMMSQNRQSEKDRLMATHDYEVNLKAELEIMGLHEKLDQMRVEQLAKLIETQNEQIKMLTALVESNRR
jgi:uncharacterized membrane protein